MIFKKISKCIVNLFLIFSSSTNNVSDKNLQHSIYANSPIYRNLNNSLNEHRLNQSIYSKQSICEYYIPCEYCLQSINNDDFEAHQVLRLNENHIISLYLINRMFAVYDVLLNLLPSRSNNIFRTYLIALCIDWLFSYHLLRSHHVNFVII